MRKLTLTLCTGLLTVVGSLMAQSLSPAPQPPLGLPSDLPSGATPPPSGARVIRPVPAPRFNNVPQQATTQPALAAQEQVLTWDSLSRDYTASPGETTAHYTFKLANTSKEVVTINWVRPSCGCTTSKMPPLPWKIAPGEGGEMNFDIDLRGKYGTLSKYVNVDTSHGQKMLTIKAIIPAGQPAAPGVDARTRNMQLAMADRQAVFKNDCAGCHSTPTIGKKAEPLYQAGCAVCHDAPHRATMVPDLRAVKTPQTREYWLHWITNGKPGSLMPAFSHAQGGPLSQEQIESLADYLTQRSQAQASAKPANAAATRN